MSWKLELSNWTNASDKSLDLIHTKADEAFTYTLGVSDRISARAFTLISILIPIVSLMIGLLSRHLFNASDSLPLSLAIPAVLLCALTVSCLGTLIWLVFPKKFMHAGREPREIALPDFVQSSTYTPDEAYKALLMFQIEDLQHKIGYNDAVNNRRLRWLKGVIIVIAVTLLVSIIFLVLYSALVVGV